MAEGGAGTGGLAEAVEVGVSESTMRPDAALEGGGTRRSVFLPPELVEQVVGFSSLTLLQFASEEAKDEVAERCVVQERHLNTLRLVGRAFKDSVDRLDLANGASFANRIARHVLNPRTPESDLAAAAPFLRSLEYLASLIGTVDDVCRLNAVLAQGENLRTLIVTVRGEEVAETSLRPPACLVKLLLQGVVNEDEDEDEPLPLLPVPLAGMHSLKTLLLRDVRLGEDIVDLLNFAEARALEEVEVAYCCTRTLVQAGRAWKGALDHLRRALPGHLEGLKLAASPFPCHIRFNLGRILEGRRVQTLSLYGISPKTFEVAARDDLCALVLAGSPAGVLSAIALEELSSSLDRNLQIGILVLSECSMGDAELASLRLKDTGVKLLALGSNSLSDDGLRSFTERLPADGLPLLSISANSLPLKRSRPSVPFVPEPCFPGR